MGLFEHFPYTNFHRLNLEWILRKLKNLEDRIAALENEIEALKERISTLENRVDTIEAEIAELKARMSNAESEIVMLKGRVSDLETRATNLENRLTAAEQRLSFAEDDIDNIYNRLDAAESAITGLTVRLTAAENTLTDLSGRMTNAESSIAALQDMLQTVSIGSTITGNRVVFAQTVASRFGNVVSGHVTFTVQAGDGAPYVDLPKSVDAWAVGYKSITGSAQGSYLEPSVLISGSIIGDISRFYLNTAFFPIGDTCGLFFTYNLR